MNLIENICTGIGKQDPNIKDYLKIFYDKNKELDESAFVDKLKNDSIFNLLTVNSHFKHVKRTSDWINFWSILLIIGIFISIIVAILTSHR